VQELPVYLFFKPQFPVKMKDQLVLSDITCYSINRIKNLWLILNNIYIAICIESGKKSSSLDYCFRTPCRRLVRDPHGRLVGDPQILVGDIDNDLFPCLWTSIMKLFSSGEEWTTFYAVQGRLLFFIVFGPFLDRFWFHFFHFILLG